MSLKKLVVLLGLAPSIEVYKTSVFTTYTIVPLILSTYYVKSQLSFCYRVDERHVKKSLSKVEEKEGHDPQTIFQVPID